MSKASKHSIQGLFQMDLLLTTFGSQAGRLVFVEIPQRGLWGTLSPRAYACAALAARALLLPLREASQVDVCLYARCH